MHILQKKHCIDVIIHWGEIAKRRICGKQYFFVCTLKYVMCARVWFTTDEATLLILFGCTSTPKRTFTTHGHALKWCMNSLMVTARVSFWLTFSLFWHCLRFSETLKLERARIFSINQKEFRFCIERQDWELDFISCQGGSQYGEPDEIPVGESHMACKVLRDIPSMYP